MSLLALIDRPPLLFFFVLYLVVAPKIGCFVLMNL